MPLAFRRILVPVDFSPASKGVLDWAVGVAKQFGASIDVLHAWDAPRYSGAELPEVTVEVQGEGRKSLPEFVRNRAAKALEEVIADLERRGIRSVEGKLEEGDPVEVILRVAESGYDLLVMGTHGRTGLSRLFLGSVAEKVVRAAACPVLTVRLPPDQSAKAGGEGGGGS